MQAAAGKAPEPGQDLVIGNGPSHRAHFRADHRAQRCGSHVVPHLADQRDRGLPVMLGRQEVVQDFRQIFRSRT